MIRAERFNEKYYALSNTPTFNQFKEKYHFTDQYNRQYMIAINNKEIFQNESVQFKKKKNHDHKPLHCIKNMYGYIKLYVKLPSNNNKWFGARDINKNIILSRIRKKGILTENIDETFTVILKSTEHPMYKRSTGIIYVKGLDIQLCNDILNK